ncbi:MAG: hypothetical protein ACTSR1_09510 [Candidatus Heimdallarchaeota archaeon]
MDDSVYDQDNIGVLGIFKNKKKSVSQYRKTSSSLFKITLFLGIFLLIVFIILKAMSFMGPDSEFYELSNSTVPGTVISISIILFAVAVIMYFFDYQFSKLEKIIEEVESGKGPIFEEDEEEKT